LVHLNKSRIVHIEQLAWIVAWAGAAAAAAVVAAEAAVVVGPAAGVAGAAAAGAGPTCKKLHRNLIKKCPTDCSELVSFRVNGLIVFTE
jgi:hypothetical protein